MGVLGAIRVDGTIDQDHRARFRSRLPEEPRQITKDL